MRYKNIDGIVAELPEKIWIAVDISIEGDTCVEWRKNEDGTMHILDIYKSQGRKL